MVSDARAAARLLHDRLGVRQVQLADAHTLTVPGRALDAGAAVQTFVQAGLTVQDAHLYEDTLEDYFKRVTGGEGIG